MTDNFRITELAAARRKRGPRRKAEPVITVAKAHSGAVMLAHELAAGRDVRIEVQRDGSILIKNGARK